MKLNDICEVYSGYALKSFNDSEEGVPVIKIGNILTDGTLNLSDCQYTMDNVNEKYYSNKGDIYIALSGATTGKIGIMDSCKRYIINQRVGIVRKKSDGIPQEYLKYFLLRQTDRILQEATGCAQPNISPKQISEYIVPKCSKSEMLGICDILDRTKSIIDKRKIELEELDNLIKARFVELFGDPIADSMHWGQVPLSHYLKSIRYGTSTPPSFSETGYEFIRATNIKNGKIISSDMKYISEEEAQKIEKCKVLGSEMIIVRSGVNAGDTCIITDEHCGQYAGYDMILVFTEELNPVFVNVLINTEYMDRVVKPLTRRAAQPHLNSEQVQGLPIIQVPYAQQEQFAAFVEQTDKSKLMVQKALDEAQLLFDSLMQKYFG